MPGGRKRTPIWNFFSQVSGRATCNDCNYSCSMDAKRMQKHRLEFHREESSILDPISDESQDDQPRVAPKQAKMDAFTIATPKADKNKKTNNKFRIIHFCLSIFFILSISQDAEFFTPNYGNNKILSFPHKYNNPEDKYLNKFQH